MKPRCQVHKRTMRWKESAGVWWCRVYGCTEFSTLPAPERKDLFPEHKPKEKAKVTSRRARKRMRRGKPLVYRGRRSQTRVTKGGRVILGRREYEKLCRQLWVERGKRCEYCGRSLPVFSTRLFDHKKKRSQGGGDTSDNLKLACWPCHDLKDNQAGERKTRDRKSKHEKGDNHDGRRNSANGERCHRADSVRDAGRLETESAFQV